MTGSRDAICQWLRHELTSKHHVNANSMRLSPAAVCPPHRHCVLRFAFVARVPVSSHLSCVCGSVFPRAFASCLSFSRRFVCLFPGNCRSGMSFQLMDPAAKLPKFTTRVAAAVSPSCSRLAHSLCAHVVLMQAAIPARSNALI